MSGIKFRYQILEKSNKFIFAVTKCRVRSLIGKGGEEMQFEEIYARYYKEVYYYLLSLDGNRETAEELTRKHSFVQ